MDIFTCQKAYTKHWKLLHQSESFEKKACMAVGLADESEASDARPSKQQGAGVECYLADSCHKATDARKVLQANASLDIAKAIKKPLSPQLVRVESTVATEHHSSDFHQEPRSMQSPLEAYSSWPTSALQIRFVISDAQAVLATTARWFAASDERRGTGKLVSTRSRQVHECKPAVTVRASAEVQTVSSEAIAHSQVSSGEQKIRPPTPGEIGGPPHPMPRGPRHKFSIATRDTQKLNEQISTNIESIELITSFDALAMLKPHQFFNEIAETASDSMRKEQSSSDEIFVFAILQSLNCENNNECKQKL